LNRNSSSFHPPSSIHLVGIRHLWQKSQLLNFLSAWRWGLQQKKLTENGCLEVFCTAQNHELQGIISTDKRQYPSRDDLISFSEHFREF
jgi:hypothetical protein